jgi:outer membrane protein
MKKLIASSVIAVGMLSPVAWAKGHSSDFVLRAGATVVAPKHSIAKDSTIDDVFTTGAGIDINHNTEFGVGVTYMFHKNFGAELAWHMLSKHRFTADGGVSTGTVMGSSSLALPTLNVQWYPMDKNTQFRPYLGAGIAHAHFSKSTVDQAWLTAQSATSGFLNVKNKTGWDAELGLDVSLYKNWSANVSARYAHIHSQFDLYTELNMTGVRAVADINPVMYNVGVAYSF